jgi:hypothetical protein
MQFSIYEFIIFANISYGLQVTFEATASAGFCACVPVRWHKCPHAGANACEPSETRIGCEPLLATGILLFY